MRNIVLLRRAAGQKALASALGVKMARASDYNSAAVRIDEITVQSPLLLDRLGIAIVVAPREQIEELRSDLASDESIASIEPEGAAYALAAGLSAAIPEARAFKE